AAWPGNSPGPELLRGGPDGPVAAFPVSSTPGRHSSPTRPGRARARMLPAPNRPAHPRGSDRPVLEPSMSLLIDIFLEPAKAFRQLQEKPSFVLPMAILAVASGLFAMLYFLYVDPEWFASHQEAQVLAGNPEMTQQELAQMRQFMPGARTLAWISAPIGLISVVVISLIMALYYLLAGKVTGTGISYRRGLCLTAWSALPSLLGVVAGLVAMYAGSNQVAFESLQMLN